MASKFLVLGASSFYGSNFAKYVEERGDFAIRWQRPTWKLDGKGDVWMFDDPGFCDYIVNFAAMSLVAESWSDPTQWMYINGAMTTNMFENLRHLRIKRFIHVSTPEVYGSTDGWVDEHHAPWKPSTPYAVSRAAADMMLMAYQRAYGFPAIITRTANIYGPGQPAHRFIPMAFETLRRGDKLLLHGGGHTVRAWIHVKDACAATYLIAKQGTVGQSYHISTQHEHSVQNVAKRICRILGKHDSILGSQPDRLGKDHAYLLKSDTLRNMGWRDTYTLDRGLQEYANGR